MSQLISTSTRPGVNSGTCIDWIVTNSTFVKYSGTLNVFISDHYATECVRKKARESKKTVLRNCRCFKGYNKKIMSGLLQARIAGSTFDIELDPNAKWNILYTIIYDILSVMCPVKIFRQ